MKKLAILGCVALLAGACGSDNNSPNGPSALPTTIMFTRGAESGQRSAAGHQRRRDWPRHRRRSR